MRKVSFFPLPFDGVLLKALSVWNLVRTVRVLLGG